MSIENLIFQIEESKGENNYTKARLIALDALKSHTDDYRLYEELADIYLFEGDLEKAQEVLTVARELHPESNTGMYLDGYIASARGEFDRAIVILTQANKNLPNNPEILRNLGWAYVMRAEVPRGISLLRRAYTISPDEPMIINDLSIALIAAGEDAEARSILAKLGNRDIRDALKIDTL